MHDIEPYFKWRDYYTASEDEASPFYGRIYSEFEYSQKIYNYYIHPQWDHFGSQTLYMKVLFADYNTGIACIELMGEWNDCLHNDVMFLKREIVDKMLENEIDKFILFCDNVLVFHGGDDDYYGEWQEEVAETGGWIALVNVQAHVMKDMEDAGLQYYVNLSPSLNDLNWRKATPKLPILEISSILEQGTNQLRY